MPRHLLEVRERGGVGVVGDRRRVLQEEQVLGVGDLVAVEEEGRRVQLVLRGLEGEVGLDLAGTPPEHVLAQALVRRADDRRPARHEDHPGGDGGVLELLGRGQARLGQLGRGLVRLVGLGRVLDVAFAHDLRRLLVARFGLGRLVGRLRILGRLVGRLRILGRLVGRLVGRLRILGRVVLGPHARGQQEPQAEEQEADAQKLGHAADLRRPRSQKPGGRRDQGSL